MKILPFCLQHEAEIKIISKGNYWCSTPGTTALRAFILTTYFPLLAHAQSIEVAVKDLTLCKTTHRDEITSTYVASMCSFFLPAVK